MQPNPYQSMNYNIQQAYPQYGYNPYFQQTRMQQPQIEQVQSVNQLQQQMPRGVNGRVVQSVEMITANDVPMDGSVAFFPMQDMSAIVAKQWDANGTIRKTVYKPFNEQMADSLSDDKRIEIGLSDDATKAITDKLDCLFGKMEELEDKLSSQTQRKSSRTQKESES